MDKRMVIAAVALALVNCGRARTSPAFSITAYEYLGCDPAVSRDPGACAFVSTTRTYVDPGVGIAQEKSASQLNMITKFDGTFVQVFPALKGYSRANRSVNLTPTRRGSTDCGLAGGALIGKATILGIETFEYRQGAATPGQEFGEDDGTVSWRAPSLGCFPLRTEYHFRHHETDFEVASSVMPGRPPASVFEPPAGYVEMSQADAQEKLLWRNRNGAQQASLPTQQ